MADYCEVCGREIDMDEYGECESCGKFFCADHNGLEKGICPECLGIKKRVANFKPFFSLICGLNNEKITRKRFVLEWRLIQEKQEAV